MIYFISGHRDLSYEDFVKYYVPEIELIFDWDEYPEFVIGDCDGVDKFAMDYLVENYSNYATEVTIYHMFATPRNTPLGNSIEGYLKVREIPELESLMRVNFIGGFKSDEERDAAMTKVSDCDIAFIKNNRWNSGTARNIKRRHEIQY